MIRYHMSFSVKQLFVVVLVISAGLAALANADKPFVAAVMRLSILAVLVIVAYSIWTSEGEPRAFRIGFLSWGGLYFLLHVVLDVESLHFGTRSLLSPLLKLQPDVFERDTQGVITGVHGSLYDQFFRIGHCLFALLFGLIGGWVTVYFYRKRQQMLLGKRALREMDR